MFVSRTETLDIENFAELDTYLQDWATPRGGVLSLRNIAGGVSSRTVWVQWRNGEAWVLKQALLRLRVDVDWFSDPARMHREALATRILAMITPTGSIAELIFEDQRHNLLAMQAVPLPHQNWKYELLAGRLQPSHAEQFGTLLGTIHGNSARQLHTLPSDFGDTSFFESLRIEPYYRFTAEQLPQAAGYLKRLIDETRGVQLALVHGDYSPKNILIREGRIVLLDHEVAHLGDPAFDIGFALAHLLSKANHLPERRKGFAQIANIFWACYRLALGGEGVWGEVEARGVRHALGCLLARVAGRSPLEYLRAEERVRQKTAVMPLLSDPPRTIPALIARFIDLLDSPLD
jgi:fructosamine-3-kinase